MPPTPVNKLIAFNAVPSQARLKASGRTFIIKQEYIESIVLAVQDSVIRVRLKEAIDRHAQSTGRRMTYSELSSLAGVAQATIESLASRRSYNATLKTLTKLCVALRCSPGELLELEPASRTRRSSAKAP